MSKNQENYLSMEGPLTQADLDKMDFDKVWISYGPEPDTLALLGDHDAAQRVTERGELLPCQCGGKPQIVCFEKRGIPSGDMGYLASVKCPDCWAELRRWSLKKKWAKESAIKGWNTRAPILTETQLALLKIAQEPRKFEEGTK